MKVIKYAWASRSLGAAVMSALLVASVGAVGPRLLAAPQLRGSGLSVPIQLIVSMLIGMCFFGSSQSRFVRHEHLSPRRLAPVRVGLYLLAVLMAGALGAVSSVLAGGDAELAMAAARNAAGLSGAVMGAARLIQPTTALSSGMAYTGACLFAGSDSLGVIDAWAWPLQQSISAFGTVTALGCIVLGLSAAVVRPRLHPECVN